MEVSEKIWFVFYDGKLVLSRSNGGVMVSTQPPLRGRVDTLPHDIGELDGRRCMAYETDLAPDESDFTIVPLRESFSLIERCFYEKAGHGAELLFWDSTTKYCSRCGGTTKHAGLLMKQCTSCATEIYPHVAPAVIVLVHKGDSVLMVQGLNFRGSFYGLVAGFLEPGETLEQCVKREVLEETGLIIDNIRYFASQPWPYPCGQMIGFNADYVSGEIKLQETELKAARFFTRDALPELPSKLSLARALIDHWLGEEVASR